MKRQRSEETRDSLDRGLDREADQLAIIRRQDQETPEPQLTTLQPEKPTRGPGRPSKLEMRAWELYSRNVTVAMARPHRHDKFREAVLLAEEFETFWRARK